MHFWGGQQEFTEQDVLYAVQQHMFHQGDIGAMRFGISAKQKQDRPMLDVLQSSDEDSARTFQK